MSYAVYEFDINSIPLERWEDKKTDIGTALHRIVTKIELSKDARRIIVHTVSARSCFPVTMYWRDDYLPAKNFVLALGESLTGRVTINFAKIPHILLGGSTGSGKSVLLRLLLMQAIKKGAVVYIADFKGGVDFSPVWHEKCKMCFEQTELLEVLTDLVNGLERRKTAFQAVGTPNLDEYNKTTGENLPRCIFACDEVAEVLDKTGLNKEQKELIGQIESRLSIIARQGRAFGIHLILSTQRPDANILSGQIKNNMDYRVCGRADNVLLQIILDSTAAADEIPKDAQGRFINNLGEVFQSYLFDDSVML